MELADLRLSAMQYSIEIARTLVNKDIMPGPKAVIELAIIIETYIQTVDLQWPPEVPDWTLP